jgi:uncharacterized Zn finger protein
MGRYDNYYDFAPYVPVAEKKRRNQKASAKLQEKTPDSCPVVILGRSLATSWWGKSWNTNLERYADYSNRIGRGRSYVRHGAVLDLKIEPGMVRALVQGSGRRPYEVTVTIKKLPALIWKRLCEESLSQVDSLTDLLAGKFPAALKDAFFAQGEGLFPSPKEISFDCSCPDWASMCKHVAAVLYGVGNRLDQSPELLFKLRQVSVDSLIAQTIDHTAQGLIGKAEQASGDDILEGADLGDMFGIDLDDAELPEIDLPPVAATPSAKPAKTKSSAKNAKPAKAGGAAKSAAKPAKTKSAAKNAKSAKAGGAAKSAAKPAKTKSAAKSAKSAKPAKPAKAVKPVRPASKKGTAGIKSAKRPQHGKMLDQFMAAFGDSRRSFKAGDLEKLLPQWSSMQVINTLARAHQAGRLERTSPGSYRKV